MKATIKVQDYHSTSAVQGSDAGRLLRLIALNENTPTSWQSADVEAMFSHQMAAELDFDLSGEAFVGGATIAALKDLPEAKKSGITTFGKLFLHSEPPIGLLKLCKGFFKRISGTHPKDSPEYQVAYMCYLLSVVVARLRHGKRITNLGDSELLQAIEWALKQAWVEKSHRKVLTGARSVFSKD